MTSKTIGKTPRIDPPGWAAGEEPTTVHIGARYNVGPPWLVAPSTAGSLWSQALATTIAAEGFC